LVHLLGWKNQRKKLVWRRAMHPRVKIKEARKLFKEFFLLELKLPFP
jgi:hypothetical protein